MLKKQKIIILILITLLININIYAKQKKHHPPVLSLNVHDTDYFLQNNLKKHALKITQYLTAYVDNDLDYLSNETILSFKKFLYSIGYFSAQIDCYATKNFNSQCILINCDINPGQVFLIENIRMSTTPLPNINNKQISLPNINSLSVKLHKPVIAKDILDIQNEIEEFVEKNNCLFLLNTTHTLFIDKTTNRATIDYNIKYGDTAYIKNITFTGLTKTKEDYVLHLSKLDCPSCFQNSKLQLAKTNLNKSGIVAVSEIVLPKYPDSDGGVDVNFCMVEQKTRTGKVGIKYTSDLGTALDASLIHRNLFGTGKKLINTLTLSKKLKLLDNSYTDLYFLRSDQKLLIQNIIKHEKSNAYYNKEMSIASSLEREIFSKVTAGGGIKYGINKVTDEGKSKDYAFISFPLFLVYDYKNNITDPQYGFLTKFEITPYINTLKNDINFLKHRISGATYLPITKNKNTIIALRGNIGSINKIKATNIPITERFFAGGSNSIRGYRYQTVGPLNNNRKPIGGSSIVELSGEIRHKVNEDFGIVTFLDAGNVFQNKIPKLKSKLFMSTGLGVRYYTTFGPIRADIAFPISKRRRKVDNIFQIYFSIGQAF